MRRRKNAEQIEKCAYMAAALTRQLLTFSRKQAIEPRVLQLNDVIRNIERMLRRLIGEDIEFTARRSTRPQATSKPTPAKWSR